VQSEGGFPVGIDREVIPPHRDDQPSKINLSRATEDPPTPHYITPHDAPSTSPHTFFCLFGSGGVVIAFLEAVVCLSLEHPWTHKRATCAPSSMFSVG